MFFLGVGKEDVEGDLGVFSVHACPGENRLEVRLEGFIHHVVHDFPRRVVGTGLFAGRRLCFRVVAGKEILKDLAEQLRIKGDLLFDGRILMDGEFVAIENVDNAPDLILFALCAVGLIQVNVVEIGKKQVIGDPEHVVLAVGKAVDPYDIPFSVGGDFLVEALEQAAVQKGDIVKISFKGFLGIDEIIRIPEDIVDHVVQVPPVLPFSPELAASRPILVHLRVEGCKKEVLKNGLVVCAAVEIDKVQQALHDPFVKDRIGNQALLLDKPDKDEARDQADHACGVADISVFFRVLGKFHLLDSPKVPIGKLAVETFVQLGDVECLLPCPAELDEIRAMVRIVENRQ
ncbi:MAG: hypothetical protein A4E63_01400 [Syntrophorhabdus sp. PtaU1.Bin050]|nr:MAG: hypothetical protein A4E63_01400 [Syntrophorhabdus sp. PtaU1.Bin050]